MITYVNSVFVSDKTDVVTSITAANDGKFLIMDADSGKLVSSVSGLDRIKVGMIDASNTQYDHEGNGTPLVRWSNIIQKDDIKSFSTLEYTASTEDEVVIDFTNLDAATLQKFAQGGKRIIVRLTFKDTPTRYRKWTESYEYVTQDGDTKATIAANIAALINKQWKRARVVANGSTTNKVILTAMTYDDDNSVNTINKANKVRFNVNIYYTDPAADGWESHNKNYPTGVTIEKTPGYEYPASAKLVRDRENESFGYMGILNRGEGTWPIIQPAMRTDLSTHYDALTLEFENMYRAADDIFRKTKQTLEIYTKTTADTNAIASALATFASAAPTQDTDMDTKDGQPDA